MVPILSQIHPLHTFPHYFPKIYSSIILLFMPVWTVEHSDHRHHHNHHPKGLRHEVTQI
jgi:hypothetical protein